MTATELLFERSPLGMALLDAELRYTRVNEALAALWRTAPQDMLGRTPEELQGSGVAELQRSVASVVGGGGPIAGMEVTGVVDDDVRRWILTCFSVDDGAAIILGDVTERRRTESWLVRQHARNALLATAARELDLAAGRPALRQRAVDPGLPPWGSGWGSSRCRRSPTAPPSSSWARTARCTVSGRRGTRCPTRVTAS